MLKRISKSLHLVLVLQKEHVVLLAQRDCEPFPPSVKVVLVVFSRCFLIVDNFVIFGIFEQVLSQDGVITVGKGYKFT